MTTPNSQPTLTTPPRPQAEFSLEYANQLYRWLQAFEQQQNGFMFLRANGLYYPGIAPIGYGLRVGEVFSNDGILTVVQTDDIWAGSLSATVELGSVTVTV
jgi:hypothetical protein